MMGENGFGVCVGEWLVGYAICKLNVECIVMVVVSDIGSDPVVGVGVGDVYAGRGGSGEWGGDGACVDDGVGEAGCIGVCLFDELEEEEDVIVNEARSVAQSVLGVVGSDRDGEVLLGGGVLKGGGKRWEGVCAGRGRGGV
jgi:hypothetical protein